MLNTLHILVQKSQGLKNIIYTHFFKFYPSPLFTDNWKNYINNKIRK